MRISSARGIGRTALLLAIAMATVFTPLMAQPGAVIEEKIGFINFRQALLSTDQAKAAAAEIERYREGRHPESRKKLEEVNSLAKVINERGGSFKGVELREMEMELEGKQSALRRFQEYTQREIDWSSSPIVRMYGSRMQTVIYSYAEANSFRAIFALYSQPFGYVDPQWDLTESMIAAYNQKWPDPRSD